MTPEEALALAGLVVGGYLVGAISPAAIVARHYGKDLRAAGSGNPGATNVGRVLGRRWGVTVGLLDVLKGLAPALLALEVVGRDRAFIVGLAAVLGHVTSPYLRGRGGKGVATSLGVVVALAPLWVAAVALVFVVVFVVTRWVGGASAASALALLAVSLLVPPVWGDSADLWSRLFGLALVLVVLGRHRSNLVLRWMARKTRLTG